MKIHGLVMFSFLCLGAERVSACAPCPGMLSLEEAVRQADTIIIAERDGHKTDKDPDSNRPETITVRSLQVLKGRLKPLSVTTLHSGLCGGAYLGGSEKALLLLTRYEAQGLYYPVKGHCSPAQHPVRNGRIMLKDSSIAIEEFSRRYLK